jgi:hypothetical protein
VFGVRPRHPEGARIVPHPSEDVDPPCSDSVSADQVEVVVGLHDQVVQGLFAIGLAVQSSSTGQDLSAQLRDCVDRLTAVLDAAIRSAQLAASEVPGAAAAACASDGPTGTPPVGQTGGRDVSWG